MHGTAVPGCQAPAEGTRQPQTRWGATCCRPPWHRPDRHTATAGQRSAATLPPRKRTPPRGPRGPCPRPQHRRDSLKPSRRGGPAAPAPGAAGLCWSGAEPLWHAAGLPRPEGPKPHSVSPARGPGPAQPSRPRRRQDRATLELAGTRDAPPPHTDPPAEGRACWWQAATPVCAPAAGEHGLKQRRLPRARLKTNDQMWKTSRSEA